MGTKYSSQATSGYNSSPPPDDGTQVAANLISWSAVKTKLADVLKTFAEAINTALVSALDLSARAIASNDTAIASDHWKTLQVTGATTITLSSAASMGAGYEVGIFNAGASTVTVTPGLASDTINNLSASVTIPIKGTMIFRTNQALTGYNIVGQSNVASNDFTAQGTIKGASTISVGNATPSVSGAGVSFPATQSASSDANTLDDYEEGTWTPSVGGSATYTSQIGTYTKIGRLVYIRLIISINVIGTGSTTTITGLPFTPAVNAILSNNIVSSVTAIVSADAIARTGTDIIFNSRTAANASPAANAIFQNGTTVTISGQYEI